jgi:hypothetical protein
MANGSGFGKGNSAEFLIRPYGSPIPQSAFVVSAFRFLLSASCRFSFLLSPLLW